MLRPFSIRPTAYTALSILLMLSSFCTFANNTAQSLPFSQNWTDTGLITGADDWSAVPGIIGFRGDNLTVATGIDAQTVVADDSPGVVDVVQNIPDPNVNSTGGVGELEVANPSVALQGSGTADAPYILLHLNTTGNQNIQVAYLARDMDGSADNAAQQLALMFRIGNTGAFTNVPAAYIADATTGGSATQTTPISVILPASADNQSLVQVRILTTNAAGNDEWVGIDDISVTGTPIAAALPTLTIANNSIAEGSSGCVGGVTQLNFTVTASSAPASNLNFTFSTADAAVGPTFASAGSDYTAVVSGTGSIDAGATTGTATVNISCDLQVEENETFTVNLVDTADYDLGDPASATGTINNDDVATIVINDVSAPEGTGSDSTFSFTVSLAGGVLAGSGGVSVDYEVLAGVTNPATAGDDFTAVISSTANISVGNNSTTIDVTVSGDGNDELDETFVVNLSNAVNATLPDNQALGTIVNDDSTTPTFSIDSNVEVTEDDGQGLVQAAVTVSVFPAPTFGNDINVDLLITDGDAVAGEDYINPGTQTLTFTSDNAGPQVVNITIIGDTTPELDETFDLRLDNATGISLIHATQGSRTVTILNDDVQRTLSIDPASLNITEGNAGTQTIDFNVMLDGPSPYGEVTFNATTSGSGNAADSNDYVVLTNAPFSIQQGQVSTTITVTINGDLRNEPDESFTLSLSAITGTNVVAGTIEATATITNDDTPTIEIHDIQGNTARSSFAPASGTALGTVVTTVDNVVTALAPNGFFIQTPDTRIDINAQTSQGIFVFTSAAPSATIEVGDVVSVRGAVMEFFDFTQLSGTLIINEEASGAALPTALELDHMTPSPDPAALSCGQTLGNFECYESQLVTVPAGVVVNGNLTFGTDPFAEVYVSSAGTRYRREEGVRFGLTGPLGVPVWDGNPEAFELDADKLLPANNGRAIIGGSLFSATGVIGYDFGGYELWPTQLDVIEETLPRQVPVATSNQLTMGSFNLFRLCATVNCDSPAPTGPEIAAKIARLSDYIRTTLRSPDVLGVQEVETIALLQQLATQIATDGGPTYTSYLVEGFDVGGIDVGFLVREDRVDVTRVRQLAETEVIDNPAGCSGGVPGCIKHDRPPLLLEGVYTANGANFPFAVMNNHTRSRGSLDTGADTARVRLKRFAQGESIAQLVQRFQTGQELEPGAPTGNTNTVDVPLILVGDYNTFEVTDGWVDVLGLIAGTYDNADNELQLAANITDPVLIQGSASIPVEERYSYAFEENFGNIQGQAPRRVRSVQILDHGLVNHIAHTSFSGMTYGRTNVDAPRYLETNGTDGVGSSDHDGFVMYFNAAPLPPLPDLVFSDGFEN